MSSQPPDDPFLAAEVERKLRLYKKLLPPQQVQTMREVLTDALRNHRLLEQIRPRPAVQESGDVVPPGRQEVHAPKVAQKKSRGQR